MATFNGTSHSDGLVGTAENDVMRGFADDDALLGLGADDILDGGSGDDSLFGGEGQDYYIGGRGLDAIAYGGTAGAINVDLRLQNRAQDTGGDGVEWLSSIEGVTGGSFDDLLNGNNKSNVLGGGEGDDLLTGRGGGDVLEPGQDFQGSPFGDDTADGGAGRDAVVIRAGTLPVTCSLLIQGTAQDTGVGTVVLIDVEDLFGGDVADTLIGSAGNNILGGGWNGDLMQGGDGADMLWGAGGPSGFRLQVDGGSQFDGDDTLEGGEGADTLVGSVGSDRLVGGKASDWFVFIPADVSIYNAGDIDLIVALEAKDWIDLSGVDADAALAGDQAFTVVSAPGPTAGQVRIWFDGVDTWWEMNTDADADLEAIIKTAGDHTGHGNLVL